MHPEPIHETANLALYKFNRKKRPFEIHLKGIRSCHAVLCGYPQTEERGRWFMEMMERYARQLREFHQHW